MNVELNHVRRWFLYQVIYLAAVAVDKKQSATNKSARGKRFGFFFGSGVRRSRSEFGGIEENAS